MQYDLSESCISNGKIKMKHSTFLSSDTILISQVLIETTDGRVDRSTECTGNVNAMISAYKCIHDVCSHKHSPIWDQGHSSSNFCRRSQSFWLLILKTISGLGCRNASWRPSQGYCIQNVSHQCSELKDARGNLLRQRQTPTVIFLQLLRCIQTR